MPQGTGVPSVIRGFGERIRTCREDAPQGLDDEGERGKDVAHKRRNDVDRDLDHDDEKVPDEVKRLADDDGQALDTLEDGVHGTCRLGATPAEIVRCEILELVLDAVDGIVESVLLGRASVLGFLKYSERKNTNLHGVGDGKSDFNRDQFDNLPGDFDRSIVPLRGVSFGLARRVAYGTRNALYPTAEIMLRRAAATL